MIIFLYNFIKKLNNIFGVIFWIAKAKIILAARIKMPKKLLPIING